MKLAPKESSSSWPQFEGEWRRRTKYAFFADYVKKNLTVPWERYFVACQFNGRECPALRVSDASTATPLAGVPPKDNLPFLGTNHWTIDPGRLHGYEMEDAGEGTAAPKNKTERMKSGKKPVNVTAWPTNSPVMFLNPAKYQCFQVSLQCIKFALRRRSSALIH